MSTSLSRTLVASVVSAAVLALSAGPVEADKLVVFKNGKAMRVKTVQNDGKWLKCEFEDKNSISVLASTVAEVEEAAGSLPGGDLRPNQVAQGSGGPAGGVYTPPNQGASISFPAEINPAGGAPQGQTEDSIQADVEAEQAAILAEQQAAQQRAFGGLRRYGANPQVPAGFQPIQNLVKPTQQLPGRSLSTRDAAGAQPTVRGTSIRDRLAGNEQSDN